jgi:hypothetical protein
VFVDCGCVVMVMVVVVCNDDYDCVMMNAIVQCNGAVNDDGDCAVNEAVVQRMKSSLKLASRSFDVHHFRRPAVSLSRSSVSPTSADIVVCT